MPFKNEQWEVTEFGLEAIPGSKPKSIDGITVSYEIEAERLAETTDRERAYYDWPVHMAEKTWVDIEAFIEAFANALDIHKMRYQDGIDLGMLEASYRKARQIAAGRD